MFFIDTSSPVVVLVALGIVLALIYLGKEAKNAYVPLISLISFLIILVMHVIQYSSPNYSQYSGVITKCLAVDFIMIFIAYMSYLWVDDIETRAKKKKSIDNSLDWFWKNV